MILLTEAQKRCLPSMSAQASEDSTDPMVYVKFFDPCGAATWLLLEFDHTDGDSCYGWVTLGFGPECDELGYFSLAELQAFRGRFGVGIERDIHFRPCPLSEAIARVRGVAV